MIFIFIIEQVRKKRLKEEYSLLWLFFSVVLLVLSVWRTGFEKFSFLIGIAYPPAAVLLVLIVAMMLILVQFSIVISKLTDKNKNLTQELALLKYEIEELKKHMK
jgi:hypothetical protein